MRAYVCECACQCTAYECACDYNLPLIYAMAIIIRDVGCTVVGIFSEPRQNGAAATTTAAVDSAVSADSVECLRQPKKAQVHTQTKYIIKKYIKKNTRLKTLLFTSAPLTTTRTRARGCLDINNNII